MLTHQYKLTVLIATQFFLFCCVAQSNKEDSLQNIVAHSTVDTAVIDAYQQLCISYQESNSDKAIEYGLLGLQKAKQVNNEVRVGNMLQSIGVSYDYKNILDSCLYYLNVSIATFKKINRLDKASHVYADIGFAHFLRGNYELALRNQLTALEIRKKFANKKHIAISYSSIGLIYRAKKDYKNALQYYKQGYEIDKTNNDQNGMMSMLMNISSAYLYSHQYDSALIFSSQSLELATSMKSEIDIISNKLNIASALVGMKKTDEALPYLQTAEHSKELTKDKGAIISLYATYGDLYLQKLMPENAKKYFEKGLAFAQANDRKEAIASFYKKLSTCLYKLGAYKLAYEYSDSSKAVADILLNEENIRQVNEMTAVYETVEKSKQIDKLTLENTLSATETNNRKRERNYFIISSILFLGLTVVACKAFVNNKRKKEKLDEQNKIIEKSLAEKEILLREIHHRVKNNLQIVSSLLSLQSNYIKDETALSAVLDGKNRVESMGLIHQNLYQDANLAVVDIQNYISNLCDNLFASYNILPSKISLQKEIQKIDLDVDTVIPLGLVINELITNCLKYAFVNKQEGGIIILKLLEHNNQIQLCVYDNGVGIPENFDSKSKKSFGYRMIQAFLQKLKGTINIYNDEGTKVDVFINNYKRA